MKKSLYSLILSDEVVCGIDRLAEQMRTNRSRLIEEVLADFLHYQTPERTVYSIFCNLERLMSDLSFPITYNKFDNVFSLKRALAYKYRPTLKYDIALFPQTSGTRAELRVNFRTQSRELESKLHEFFKVFGAVERRFNQGRIEYVQEETRWIRVKYFDADKTVEQMANELSAFVKFFDATLEKYISGEYSSFEQIQNDYETFCHKG